ncbi:MAG: 4Fe-4S binding protein [Candidatus Hydrogenedentes bacterium]|nr:4Fe-4S binding protein [Candidatus Hydrogenedentota bacterium]
MNTKDCKHIISFSSPAEGEGGLTGEWRTQKPIINQDKCIAMKSQKGVCFQCWAYCPESTIERRPFPTINYKYCKGCGICSEICPSNAIEMRNEFDENNT